MSVIATVETPVLTMKEQWQVALREVRRQGIKVRQNVRKCCRSCIMPENLGLNPDENHPYVYTYGGQENAYSWYNDELVYTHTLRKYHTKKVERVFFNHGGEGGTAAATILVDILTRHGFDVEWNGDQGSCVIVNF